MVLYLPNKVIPLVLLLVDYGANVNAQDKEGNTALHVCTINESPLRLILTFFRLGADPTIEVSLFKYKPKFTQLENWKLNNYKGLETG